MNRLMDALRTVLEPQAERAKQLLTYDNLIYQYANWHYRMAKQVPPEVFLAMHVRSVEDFTTLKEAEFNVTMEERVLMTHLRDMKGYVDSKLLSHGSYSNMRKQVARSENLKILECPRPLKGLAAAMWRRMF